MSNKLFYRMGLKFQKYFLFMPALAYSRHVIKNKPNESCVELFESDYNCGKKTERMTERCLEMTITKQWLDTRKEVISEVIEVGAVTPYYFPGIVSNVLDAYDKHEQVNLKMDMLDYDFMNKRILSISTIEHVGTGEYGLNKRNNAIFALEKMLRECKECLISFPMGYNKKLDHYILNTDLGDVKITYYKRGKFDNAWRVVERADVRKPHYSHILSMFANEVVVIEKMMSDEI